MVAPDRPKEDDRERDRESARAAATRRERSGPPPSPLAAAGVPAMPRRRRSTPITMRWIAIGLVVVGLLVVGGSVQTFVGADQALARANANAAQLVRVQDIQTLLVQADADVTNSFLVGGLEPVDQRQAYLDAIHTATTLITQAAAAQPADQAALADLSTAVTDYVGTIETARANNRQALPVGAQYLKNASAGLRADARAGARPRSSRPTRPA